MPNETHSPFTSLHSTLKACKCGWIGTNANKHVEQTRRHYDLALMSPSEFWKDHGEIPLYVDDPRLNTLKTLEASLKQ